MNNSSASDSSGDFSSSALPPLTRSEKWRDFWIGFFGYLLAHIFYWGIGFLLIGLFSVSKITIPNWVGSLAWIPNVVWGLFNLAVLIWLGIKRPYMALGMLALIALGFVLTLIAGVVFAVVCLVALSQYSG